MLYTIIEDASPYFIRFTHPGVEKVIQLALKILETVEFDKPATIPWPGNIHLGFKHHKPTREQCDSIHALVPMNHQLDLDPKRAAMFITAPGYYYRAHKDGNNRYSVNYHVKIEDSHCITNWYSDAQCSEYTIDPVLEKVANVWDLKEFDPNKHSALKSMTAVQGECCLFNTEIFHDWNNSKSPNYRVNMTLRDIDPSAVSFFDARKKLFAY